MKGKTRKIIINNKTKMSDDVILYNVHQFLTVIAVQEFSNESFITFDKFVCWFKKLKTGILSFTFLDSMVATNKEKCDE